MINAVTRAEVEKTVEPIIENCLREFGDFSPKGISAEEFKSHTVGTLRPDVRRVSLLVCLAQEVLGANAQGEGLEIGAGYGYLLFPMARFLPGIHWTAVEHPDRAYIREDAYLRAFSEHNCSLASADLLHDGLPMPDRCFQLVTFSEVLEHLPVERVNFVLSEIARVIRPGGVLIASSPNQASLENRIKLMRGRSVLEFPEEVGWGKGVFGHIRLYTASEVESAMEKLGFFLERCVMESNNSAYRGNSARSWRRRAHRFYEFVEGKFGVLRPLADTWHIAFRKRASWVAAATLENNV